MSELVDSRMPEEVVSALDGNDLGSKVGLAYMLVTPDADGSPRPCMLSAGELLAIDDRHLRVGLWPGTHTGANLSQGRTALLCFITAGRVFYVRGPARKLPSGPGGGIDAFEIDVGSVESDSHEGLPVTTGIMFGVEGTDPAALVARWRSQLEVLRVA